MVQQKQLTVKEKSSLIYTLGVLKLKKWRSKAGSVISFPLLQYRVYSFNNDTLQHLVKEIFIDKVYGLTCEAWQNKKLNLIDAGANLGLSVLFFKKAFNNLHIKAFEPAESAFKLLQKNVEANSLKDVELYQAAISNSNETLYATEGFEQGSVNQTFTTTKKAQPVMAVRLVDLLKAESFCVVKLDIEGAEIAVLEDVMQQNMLTKAACWFIEFHDTGAQREKIISEFEKSNFTYKRVKDVYCFKQKNLLINNG